MRKPSKTLGTGLVLVGLAALGGCAAADAPEPVGFVEQEWESPVGGKGVELTTDHFVLRVTTPDTALREVLPEFMEAAYAEYAALMPPAQNAGERLTVYLFGRRDEWALFTRGFAPSLAETYLHIHAGGYTDYASATAVTFDIRRDKTLSLLAHEGYHQYVAKYFPRPVIPWLNEGMATQFEAFELRGGRPNFTPLRNHLRRNDLRTALAVEAAETQPGDAPRLGLIPLRQLLATDAGEVIRQTGHPVRTYYAQVWMLILMLRNPEYRGGFEMLLADAGTDRIDVAIRGQRVATPGGDAISDGEMIFRHYITEDIDGFEEKFRAFARYLLF
jgi:hypothetical protein